MRKKAKAEPRSDSVFTSPAQCL